MNWEAIGAIGENIGALAVLITLAYLAAQIRQNTATVRSSTAQNTNAQLSQLFSLITSDPQVAEIFRTGLQDAEGLSPSDQVRFNFLLHNICTNFEDSFHQHEQGHLDPDLWRRIAAITVWYAHQPGFLTWWDSDRFIYSTGFRDFVDQARREEAPPRLWWERTGSGAAT